MVRPLPAAGARAHGRGAVPLSHSEAQVAQWSQASSLLFEGPGSFGSCTAGRLSFSGFACCFRNYFVETGVCVADPLTAVPGRCVALPGRSG